MQGERLRRIREECNLTQDDLAELVGVAVLQIYRYESEKTEPNGDMVAKLAEALHVSSDYLLGLTDEPTPRSLSGGLSTKERAVVSALRRGESMNAIKLIVADE